MPTADWATNPITVWEATLDEYGQPSYAAPRVIYGTYENGQNVQRDDMGEEFMPRQKFFLLELLDRGAYIKAGDHSAESTPPKFTGVVRKVVEFAPAPAYGRSYTQYEAYTE